VRTKRGLVDTGKVGGYCKDQVSFSGMMQLLQNRKNLSFELLHSCKLPWQSISTTPGLQRAQDVSAMLVPAFIADGEAAYQRRLDDVVLVSPAARFAAGVTVTPMARPTTSSTFCALQHDARFCSAHVARAP
jgi:hypothetical protein